MVTNAVRVIGESFLEVAAQVFRCDTPGAVWLLAGRRMQYRHPIVEVGQGGGVDVGEKAGAGGLRTAARLRAFRLPRPTDNGAKLGQSQRRGPDLVRRATNLIAGDCEIAPGAVDLDA